MITVEKHGMFLINGEVLPAANVDVEAARKGTIAYGILSAHNKSGDDKKLRIGFDALVSHDITYVGIIQTARASGLKKFPIPYALTNCHNSLCAVGGTINEDDHVFGLSAAKKYGGIYVPANQAVIHQYAREKLAACGKMILGSDSHTRYGALGTMAVGEGGPELVKQLLSNTYDIAYPDVILVHLTGKVRKGVGPHDVAIALVKAVFKDGYVKNKVLEFYGEGVKGLSMDFRNGIDVMTTETTCLSSIWQTDEKTAEYFEKHGRSEAYKELKPASIAYYDGYIHIDLDKVEPMIALPFHPSNAYTIREFKANAKEILAEVEKNAKEQFPGVKLDLVGKVTDKGVLVDQGIIAGCAGGTFENLSIAADILKNGSVGNGAFTMSVYPASTPVEGALFKSGAALELLNAGVVLKPAFCGPCFGAGDVPQNNGLSIRHATRNFPNREGSKPNAGQLATVALMDARSIAATAAAGGYLTGADEIDYEETPRDYAFNGEIYERRVFDGYGKADESAPLILGPNITDWPKIPVAKKELLARFTAVIYDAVTTTDELIPSGETSSYRSNPLKLAEFALSRRVPEYVSRCKALTKEIASGELKPVLDKAGAHEDQCNVGSIIYAIKPGDGSAREQAVSCQRVLGGAANLCKEFATKRYRSNCINWGMLPMQYAEDIDVKEGDYLFVDDVFALINDQGGKVKILSGDEIKTIEVSLGSLTEEEKQILRDGCLMNYYAAQKK